MTVVEGHLFHREKRGVVLDGLAELPSGAHVDALARGDGQAGREDRASQHVADEVDVDAAGQVAHALAEAVHVVLGGEAVELLLVDAHDPEALAGFWSDALAWPIGNRGPGLFAGLRPPRGGPWLEFVQNEDVKSGKNRVRIGVGAHSGLRNDAELARLIEVGATPADLEAPERSWRLLADPEGNEFHVHRMR